jgi:Xaa-Pro aminopeptidase
LRRTRLCYFYTKILGFMNLATIQAYLRTNRIDGWLLYDFRGLNPIALHVAGLTRSGSRRWFLWLPAEGRPLWLIHAIESSTFAHIDPDLAGEMRQYVGWRDLEEKIAALVHTPRGRATRIAMEYSPDNAIPYVAFVDAGAKELVARVTGAEIVSSADLVQLVQAVLGEEQIASHRRAAAHCLAAKDTAFAMIRACLATGTPVTEHEVQGAIVDYFTAHDLDCDHPPIVAVNAHAANPHYAPSAAAPTEIRPGDIVLIDLWARERRTPNDCYADITWMAYAGAEAPPAARHLFDVLAQARDAAVTFCNERLGTGNTVHGYEVDDVCRAVIAGAGYGEAFFHRTGHSLGVTGHYNGVNIDNLETRDRRSLIPHVMFTVEPGIYLPNFNFDGSPMPKGIGLRTEINCLVLPDRVEVTTLPVQTEIVPLM